MSDHRDVAELTALALREINEKLDKSDMTRATHDLLLQAIISCLPNEKILSALYEARGFEGTSGKLSPDQRNEISERLERWIQVASR